MISIIFSIILGILAYFFSNIIRKHYNIILALTIILSILTFVIDFDLVTQGYLGLGFFVVVMYAGALKKGSKLSKRLKSIRKEYSILGFVILLPHVIKWLLQFIDGSYPVEWFGIIAYIIMLPLFVISFNYFKKKINIKKWFGIQKWAYLAYITIFIHLLLIGQSEHIFAYSVLFGLYTFLKLKNVIFKNNSVISKITTSLVISILGIVLLLTLTGNMKLPNIGSNAKFEEINILQIEDGIYLGEATGFNNLPVSLSVEVINGEIIEINVFEYGSTSSHGGIDFTAAGNEMVNNIITTQNTSIDSISGATKTTEGIQEAIIDALT